MDEVDSSSHQTIQIQISDHHHRPRVNYVPIAINLKYVGAVVHLMLNIIIWLTVGIRDGYVITKCVCTRPKNNGEVYNIMVNKKAILY